MIEEIGTAAPMDVALLGAFTLILWDLLRGRRRGWLRVVAVVVGAPACAVQARLVDSYGLHSTWGSSERDWHPTAYESRRSSPSTG